MLFNSTEKVYNFLKKCKDEKLKRLSDLKKLYELERSSITTVEVKSSNKKMSKKDIEK